MSKENESRAFRCPLCGGIFQYENLFNSHLNNHKKKIPPPFIIGHIFINNRELDREEYVCNICMKHFPSTVLLEDHQDSHFEKYFCTTCLCDVECDRDSEDNNTLYKCVNCGEFSMYKMDYIENLLKIDLTEMAEKSV